jgi:tRNA-splicing ligase RtcB
VGPPEEGALSQIKTCAKTADKVALMADHHNGYAVPIGGVVAYKNSISPSVVGFDIACGNKAVLLDMPGSALRADISKIMACLCADLYYGSFGGSTGTNVRLAIPEQPARHTRMRN